MRITTQALSAYRWRAMRAAKWGLLKAGVSWNRVYRWMLNYQERRTTLDQILARPDSAVGYKGLYNWQQGERHVALMKREGLHPDMTVLDLGCGYGRTGIPLIGYLNEGRYIGVDLSERRIAMAKEWINREGLQTKRPRIIASIDNDMTYLVESSVDVAWTYSVFNHMPDADVLDILNTLSRVLKPGGLVFFYYVVPDPDDRSETWRPGNQMVSRFLRTEEEAMRLVEGTRFFARPISDWQELLKDAASAGRYLLLTKRPH